MRYNRSASGQPERSARAPDIYLDYLGPLSCYGTASSGCPLQPFMRVGLTLCRHVPSPAPTRASIKGRARCAWASTGGAAKVVGGGHSGLTERGSVPNVTEHRYTWNGPQLSGEVYHGRQWECYDDVVSRTKPVFHLVRVSCSRKTSRSVCIKLFTSSSFAMPVEQTDKSVILKHPSVSRAPGTATDSRELLLRSSEAVGTGIY